MSTNLDARSRATHTLAHAAQSPTQAGAEWRPWRRLSSKSPNAAPNTARPLAPLCPRLCGFRSSVALFAFACLWTVCLTGCAADPVADPPSLTLWQHDLEQYVWDRANGDPNVLADMSWDDVHKGFAVIGDALPDRSTDQIGLLLAHRVLDEKPWFLFLLGTVRRQNLEDLRPVALNFEEGEFHWSIAPPNERAQSLYRSWSEADRSRDEPADPNAPPFPRPQERFDVTVRGGAFIVRHVESGAEWELRPALRATRPIHSQADRNTTWPS